MTSVPARDLSGAMPSPARAPRHRVAMLALVAVAVLILDQSSKALISEHFQLEQRVPIVPGWLDFTYTLNPGAAFSLFATMPAGFRHVFFIVLSLAAIVVLAILLTRPSTPLSSALGCALILGGTIGNLIDRLARRQVVDFIYFHHAWFNYPVFNLADSAITIGVAILLIFSFFSSNSPARAAALHV